MKYGLLTKLVIGGLIVVGAVALVRFLPDSATVEQNAEQLTRAQADTDTVVGAWREKIAKSSPVAAYKAFKAVNGEIEFNQQHNNAHLFGEALYRETGIPGVAICDSEFGFGCYHSFFGWALLEHGLGILEELDQACIDTYGRKGLGCQHGIGHGVLVELGHEQLVDSLEACMRLDWQEPIGGCTSGVFMEYNFNTMEQADIRPVDEQGEHFPCTVVPERFLEACYFEMPAWWSARSDRDYAWVGELCEEVSLRSNKEACYRGAGNVIAGMNDYNLDEIASACTFMPTHTGEVLCIEGASWIVSNQPEFRDVWTVLCEPYEGADKEQCLRAQELI